MPFVLETDTCLITTDAETISFVLVAADVPWFRAAEVAVYLGYAQPRVAITKILRGDHSKRFYEISPFQSTCKHDDPRARYCMPITAVLTSPLNSP